MPIAMLWIFFKNKPCAVLHGLVIVAIIIIIIIYAINYYYSLFEMEENDHLGDWSPEKDCCWQLTF